MHMNASVSLSIMLNIRLRLVSMPAWRKKTEIQKYIKFCISLFLHAGWLTSINLMRSSHHVVICILIMLANAKF